jgi:hypothetical protein
MHCIFFYVYLVRRFSTPTDEAGKVREPWHEFQSIEQQHLINSEWAFIPQVFGSIRQYVDRIRYNTQCLPKCFTWHSLNYIVSLSRKMRTLYLSKDQFCQNPSPKSVTDNSRAVLKEHPTYFKPRNKHIKKISYLKIHNIS